MHAAPPTRAGTVALVGLPNAGKSSLLNRLLGSKLSIVTPFAQTTRERVSVHSEAACATCHKLIDPLGFAFENYDAIGKWRTVDASAGTPIDATGALLVRTDGGIERVVAGEIGERRAVDVSSADDEKAAHVVVSVLVEIDKPLRRLIENATGSKRIDCCRPRGRLTTIPGRMRSGSRSLKRWTRRERSARCGFCAPRFWPTSVAAALLKPQAGKKVKTMTRIAIV